MAVWDELKVILARLLDEQREVLHVFPDPRSDEDRQPPFEVWLAAWGVAVAEDLHHRFGDGVDLMVGFFPYPPDRLPPRLPAPPSPADPLDPRQAAVDLDGPAVVGSGHTLRHGLLVHNRTDAELQIATNGQVTAEVVDPATGELVGGFAGAQIMPLIVIGVPPRQTERIPLLIGTASLVPALGYAVPAGSWGVQATLDLGPPPREALRRTRVLPLTVTA